MTQQTNEGIRDILSKIAKALDPMARAHNLGTKEVQNLTKQAVSKFVRYMGRNRQDWNNVTWNTLYKFLRIPDLFGFSITEINEMVLDQEIKNKITSTVRSLPANYITDFYAKPSKVIGGDPAIAGIDERSQAIATMILELSSIRHLDKAAGGESIPDPIGTSTGPTTSPTGPTASPAGPTASPAGPSSLLRPTRQRSPDPALDSLYAAKFRIEMAAYTLQGGTP